MIVFTQLVAATKTAAGLRRLVEGELVLILSSIADVEYRAAREALEKVPLASDKRLHVALAVGHLQSAHAAYSELHRAEGWRGYFNLLGRTTALNQDIFTLSLMAVCYRYLGEFGLMQDSLASAAEAMRLHRGIRDGYTLGEMGDAAKRKVVLSAMGSWFNPGAWPGIVKGATRGFPDIDEADLRALTASLQRRTR